MRVRALVGLVVSAVCFFCASAQDNTGKRICVGVLPIFDSSGEPHAEVFGEHLQQMVFRELQSTQFEPILLNPGGEYNPLSPDWVQEYGGRTSANVVVMSSILPSDKPKKGNWTLKVQTQVMDIKTGKTSAGFTSTYEIDRRQIISGPESSRARFDSPRDYLHRGSDNEDHMTADERPFEKQPLGKAAKNIAGAVKNGVAAVVPALATGEFVAQPLTGKGSCETSVHVNYGKGKSTAYDLVVNNREESISMVDGVSRLSTNSGLLVFRIVVHDAPYRLPVQHVYQATTYLDCSRPERNVSLDIGSSGEALLRWY